MLSDPSKYGLKRIPEDALLLANRSVRRIVRRTTGLAPRVPAAGAHATLDNRSVAQCAVSEAHCTPSRRRVVSGVRANGEICRIARSDFSLQSRPGSAYA